MIITIANAKGGSGKSTLSTMLASEYSKDFKVMLVDTDIQQSAASFHSIRCENKTLAQFACVSQFQPNGLTQELKRSAENYDIILIDTSGREEGLARRAMIHSDIVLIPVQPGNFDIWATDHTVKAVQDCISTNPSLKAFFVVNNAQTRTRLELEVKRLLQEYIEAGIELFPAIVHQRVEFKTCIASGMNAVEYKNDSKAADEIRYFVKCLNKHILA